MPYITRDESHGDVTVHRTYHLVQLPIPDALAELQSASLFLFGPDGYSSCMLALTDFSR